MPPSFLSCDVHASYVLVAGWIESMRRLRASGTVNGDLDCVRASDSDNDDESFHAPRLRCYEVASPTLQLI